MSGRPEVADLVDAALTSLTPVEQRVVQLIYVRRCDVRSSAQLLRISEHDVCDALLHAYRAVAAALNGPPGATRPGLVP